MRLPNPSNQTPGSSVTTRSIVRAGARADRAAPSSRPASSEGRAVIELATDAKQVVRRLIDEVVNAGHLDAIDELYAPHMAGPARRWIAPFLASFPDTHMEIVDLVAEGETVVGRFRCSGTHLGPWRGRPPTGRRFERVNEVAFYRVQDGRIIEAWGIEDTRSRERQLGFGA